MVLSEPLVGVALKWAPLRLEVDPLTGEPAHDPLSFGVPDADRAALEVGLRLAERLGGGVRAATVGPTAAAEALREALAVGAREALHVRVDDRLLPGSPASCRRTVQGLAIAFRGCAFVVCGDYSPDGGSGSVPGLLAAEVRAAAALGLVAVTPGADGVIAERRLDRGARERVRVKAPGVLSVEASAARLRRAPLGALLAAAAAEIATLSGPADHATPSPEASLAPYRPRTRVAEPPSPELTPAERMRAILGIDEEPAASARVVVAEPAEAGREIAEQLRRWGYA